MRLRQAYYLLLLTVCATLQIASSRNIQSQRREHMKNCVSKFYNRELGPLEILMLPLGEKLWLRAWLGNHMTNLLHMEGVDLAEVTSLSTGEKRKKRSFYFLHHREEKDGHFTKRFTPKSYKVALKPNLQEGTLEGLVQINITCLEDTNKLIINLGKEMTINGLVLEEIVSLDGKNNCTRGPMEAYGIVSQSASHNQMKIEFEKNLTKGVMYQLGIQFEGNGSNTDFYYSTDYTREFLAAHLKNGNAKTVFPYYGDPFHKATFEISILRPADMKTISIMPIATSEQSVEEQNAWDHFQTTPLMSVSNLAIFIYNPEKMLSTASTASQGGVEIRGLAQAANLTKAQKIIDAMVAVINYMEKYLGVHYPIPQLRVVLLPDASATSQNYWSLFLIGTSPRQMKETN